MALWPAPKMPFVVFSTPQDKLIPNGKHETFKGIHALKFLFSIKPNTQAVKDLADFPFKFSAPWHLRHSVAVMTANVHSARLLAASVPISNFWATAARNPFASKLMMVNLRNALRVFNLANHNQATIPDALVPFACTQAAYDIGESMLLLSFCEHANKTDATSKDVISTALFVWKNVAQQSVIKPWERHKDAIITQCKRYIAEHYAYHVSHSKWESDTGLKVDHVTNREAVYDALLCNPHNTTLLTLWDVYKRMGIPQMTPVFSMLNSEFPAEGVADRFTIPSMDSTAEWLETL